MCSFPQDLISFPLLPFFLPLLSLSLSVSLSFLSLCISTTVPPPIIFPSARSEEQGEHGKEGKEEEEEKKGKEEKEKEEQHTEGQNAQTESDVQGEEATNGKTERIALRAVVCVRVLLAKECATAFFFSGEKVSLSFFLLSLFCGSFFLHQAIANLCYFMLNYIMLC